MFSVVAVHQAPGCRDRFERRGVPASHRPKAPPLMRMSSPMAIRTRGSRLWPQRARALAMTGRVAKYRFLG